MSSTIGYLHTQLPWNFITKFADGVVVHKDGILQKTFAFRAPDLDSSDAFQTQAICLRVNDFAKRLGSRWAFHVEAQRFYTQDYDTAAFAYNYPAGAFDALAPYLIDREREAAFRATGKHFESSYYLTFTNRPQSENVKKLTGMFVQSATGQAGAGIQENVEFFVNETNAIVGVLSSLIDLAPLDNEMTVAYLHSCVSMNRHAIHFPCTQIMLDRILPDNELVTSLTMKLGDYYIPIIGVNDADIT